MNEKITNNITFKDLILKYLIDEIKKEVQEYTSWCIAYL